MIIDVSGVSKSESGSLTFIIGDSNDRFDCVKDLPFFEAMGKRAFLLGSRGSGLMAKLCNNVLLALNIAFLSRFYHLSIDSSLLSKVFEFSTGSSWANTYYCPVPGVLSGAPSSKNYENGFDINLMIKDLELAKEFITEPDELRDNLFSLIETYKNTRSFIGEQSKDFSIVYQYMRQFSGVLEDVNSSNTFGR